MADSDSFDIISSISSKAIYPEIEKAESGQVCDLDTQITKHLRAQYPELTITTVPANNVPLIPFAQIGHAIATLDTKTDSIHKWRGFAGSAARGAQGYLYESVLFAKYHYKWGNEDFILYVVSLGYIVLQYVLKEPSESEHPLSNCSKTDELLLAAVSAFAGNDDEYIYVFDGYWTRSHELWEEVRNASWSKVILDEKMKDALLKVSTDFFDSEDIYKQYGVPWKRGIVFHGPPGNGKTLSVKALMHSLYNRKEPKPRLLYVKSAPQTYQIGLVFSLARAMSPCLLIMEDIETIVTPATRAYAFNEMDGLQNNNGIFMLATTNYLSRLDPGLAKRPSRFDRKYLFPLPNHNERTLYARFWRDKLAKAKTKVPFPEKLCPAIADICGEFSFAYMQEAFIATLLAIARDDIDELGNIYDGTQDVDDIAEFMKQQRLEDNQQGMETRGGGPDHDHDHPELDGYKLWRAMKTQVAILREDMDSRSPAHSHPHSPPPPPPPPSLPHSTHTESIFPPPPSPPPQIPLDAKYPPHPIPLATQPSVPSHLATTTAPHASMLQSSPAAIAAAAVTKQPPFARAPFLPSYASGGRTLEAQQARNRVQNGAAGSARGEAGWRASNGVGGF